jgi:hypothetical protein
MLDFLFLDEVRVDPDLLVPKRWDAATTREALAEARDVIADVGEVSFEADELEPPLRGWPRSAAGRRATCSWPSAWRSPAGRPRRRCSTRSSPLGYERTLERLDAHVSSGWSRYYDERGELDDEYWNIYVCHFDDEGRCTSFTEWWTRSRQYDPED